MERAMLSERDKLIIRVFGDCGLRLDEPTNLRATDMVRSNRQAFLRVLGKRNRVRDVPVMPPLLRRLERFSDSRSASRSSDRLFVSHRRGRHATYEPLTQSGVYKVVTDAANAARIQKRVYPHLLRHSWMTECCATA
jgi:integrase/recombinase XerD